MGRYSAAVASHGIVATAGMTPRRDGVMAFKGRVGADLDEEQAAAAARLAATNALRAAAAAVGGVERITALVSMTVYIVAAPGFDRLGAVADGASEALAELWGTEPAVMPARAAIGVAVLPDGAPVEVQLVAAYDEGEEQA